MKKIIYLIAVGLLTCGLAACDKDNDNFGDYSIASEMTLSDYISMVNGEVYPLNFERVFDTVFQYEVIDYDSLFNEDGTFDRRVQVGTHIKPASFTTKYYVAETFMVPSAADTFEIKVNSNAKWQCIQNITTNLTGDNAYPTYGQPSVYGGGNGHVILNFGAATKTLCRGEFFIHSSDSTIFFQLPFRQNVGN